MDGQFLVALQSSLRAEDRSLTELPQHSI